MVSGYRYRRRRSLLYTWFRYMVGSHVMLYLYLSIRWSVTFFLIQVQNTTSMPLLCLQWAAQSILSYSNNFSTGTRERSDLKNHDLQNPVHPHEDDEVLRSAEKNALIQENDLSACASEIERSVSRLLISWFISLISLFNIIFVAHPKWSYLGP